MAKARSDDIQEKVRTQKLTKHHVGVVITMMLILGTSVSIIFSAAGLCYRPLAEHFDVNVSDISLYMSMIYLGSMIGPVPAGFLFQRYNPKVVGTVASLMVIIPYAGFAFYPAVWCYWVAGFIIGLGLCCIEFTMTAGILSRWFHANYGTVTGICFAMTGAGGVIWNLVGQVILGPDLAGWQTLFMIFTVIVILGTIPGILIFVRRTPEEFGTHPYGVPLDEDGNPIELEAEAGNGDASGRTQEEPGYTTKEAVRKPFFWTMLIGCGLMNSAAIFTFMFSSYVQFLAHDGWSGSAIAALLLLTGTLESCLCAGQMGGKVLIGWIESNKSLLLAQIVGMTGGIVGIMLMWWAPQLLGEAGILPMFIGGLLFGLQYALTNAQIPFLIREVFGGKSFERIYSIQLTVYNLVGVFAATGWALICESMGWSGYFMVGIANCVIGFAFLSYTGIAGYRMRAKTWYRSDAQLIEDEKEAKEKIEGGTDVKQIAENGESSVSGMHETDESSSARCHVV